jgi:serine/threonine protein phosphatase PrpC
MQNEFALQAGSVPGMNHILPGQPCWHNNQDAYSLRQNDRASVAVVSDGCGSSPHSEVGAKIISRLITQRVMEMVSASCDSDGLGDNFWNKLHQDVLAEIRTLAHRMGKNFSRTIDDYFLATVVGVLVLPERTYVFASGDGVYAINGDIQVIEPPEDNQPAYMAYALLDYDRKGAPNPFGFSVREIPTDEIDSLLIGSDGVTELLTETNASKPKRRAASPLLSEILADETVVTNPDAIRRRLAAANTATVQVRSEGQALIKSGRFADDTTIAIIRSINSGGDSS